LGRNPRRGGSHEEGPVEPSRSPPELIDVRIGELGDWRGEMISRLRALIKEAGPEVAEEWKWKTPVWTTG
jgi:hypothetical protein